MKQIISGGKNFIFTLRNKKVKKIEKNYCKENLIMI